MNSPIAALAYALYDSESTSRLSEQPKEVMDEYFRRASALLFAIKAYQTKASRMAIAREIKKSKCNRSTHKYGHHKP